MIRDKLLDKLITDNGPDLHDFESIDLMCTHYPDQLRLFRASKPKVLETADSIIGHILHKPFGYAGDFHIIDRLYTFDASPHFPKWGKYSLQTHGARAVRNRKKYFKIILDQLAEINPKARVLNVASGPARDIFEYLQENPKSQLQFTCLDMDKRAIAYAKKLNVEFLPQIEFIDRNILRFQTNEKYDLIWSAGLFDYFKDKIFVSVLSKFKNYLNTNGEIVVGNFNEDHNPSRNYMEVLGDWFLFHRTSNKLLQLGVESGYNLHDIQIGREEENVNLFMHLRKEDSTKAFFDQYNSLNGSQSFDL